MKDLHQVLLGVLAALLSCAIILGSLSLSLAESSNFLAYVPQPSETQTPSPVPATPLNTLAPGEPTFTPTATALPSSTPTYPPPSTSCLPPPGWFPIIVQPDDTLASLAASYGITPELLAETNCLGTTVLANSIIYVPESPATATFTATLPPTATVPPTKPPKTCGPFPGWVVYIVWPGDTLYALSVQLGVSVQQLMVANCKASTIIHVGEALYVPFIPVRLPSPTLRPTLAPSATVTSRPTSTSLPRPTDTSRPPATAVPTSAPLPTETPTSAPTEVPPTAVPPTTVAPTATEQPTLAPIPTDTVAPTDALLVPSDTPVVPAPTSPPTGTVALDNRALDNRALNNSWILLSPLVTVPEI